MHHDKSMQDCVNLCWQCRTACQETLFSHCLEMGGEHVAPDHVKIMTDCIQACQVAADFMTRDSALHVSTCAMCADVCEACAESCEALEAPEMKKCADICRKCAKSCRDMSKQRIKKAA